MSRLSSQQWIVSLQQQGDSDDVIKMAPKYINTRGPAGESSLLLAANAKAYKTLKVLLQSMITPPGLGDFEVILHTLTLEPSHTAFSCLHTMVELADLWYEDRQSDVHFLFRRYADIAIDTGNTRVACYLASVINDQSLMTQVYHSPTGVVANNQLRSISAANLANLVEDLRSFSVRAWDIKFIEAFTPNIKSKIEAVHRAVTLLLSISLSYDGVAAVPDLEKELLDISQGEASEASVGALLSRGLLYLSKKCADLRTESQGSTRSNTRPSTANTATFSTYSTTPRQFSADTAKIYNNVYGYINVLNSRIHEYLGEIHRLQARLETIKSRHQKEASLNIKLIGSFSEQLKNEIDRNLMLEQKMTVRDEVIVLLNHFIKTLMEAIKSSNASTKSGAITITDTDTTQEGDQLISACLKDINSNLATMNDSFRRLENEKQSLAIIQRYALSLKYDEGDTTVEGTPSLMPTPTNEKTVKDTQLLVSELAHYRRLYFGLKAQYKSLLKLLPIDVANIASDIVLSLTQEESKVSPIGDKGGSESDHASPMELDPHSPRFLGSTLKWEDSTSALRPYMSDKEYQQYVHCATTPAGLSLSFQNQPPAGCKIRVDAVSRPRSAIL